MKEKSNSQIKPKILVLDVDGVMTTGRFYYDSSGKVLKEFGPHDSDGLKTLKEKLEIQFITADKRGFPISQKRIVEDMGYPLQLVGEAERQEYFERLGFNRTIFVGDGVHDAPILKKCLFGIAPKNARKEAKESADFITENNSAEGAVFDACIEIQRKFFSEESSQTESNLHYKVCIIGAGKGSRMKPFTDHLNKGLLPVHGKPAICHIIQTIPESVEIVFAIGYLGEQLKTYVESSFPNRKFSWIKVDNYDRPGAGPGLSLLACKKELQCPFVLANVDAIIKGSMPVPEEDWFGVAKVDDTSRFCSVKVDSEGKVVRIDDKVKTDNKYAFTGIAGIYSYKLFWDALESNEQLIAGERQVSNGFQKLKESGLKIIILNWFDTGTIPAYKHCLENFPNGKPYGGK